MAEWRKLCEADDFALEEHGVLVRFANGRSHRVTVTEHADRFELRARVVGEWKQPDAALLWERNRSSSVVSFRIDGRSRVEASAWCPRAGVTEDELQFVVRKLATEADRLEYLLTGTDRA